MTIGMNKETVGSVVAVVLVGVGGWYAFTSGSPGKGGGPAAAGAAATVAVVNGENIPRNQLDAVKAQLAAGQGQVATTTAAQAALEKQALDSVIGRTLLLQAATQAGFTASTTAVDAQIEAAKAQLGGQAGFDSMLVQQDLTEEGLRVQISENLAIQAYLEQELHLSTLTATDAEVEAAYDQVSAGQQGLPALSEVKEQMKQLVLGQKQQQLIMAQVEKLRAAGSVHIII